MNAMNPSGSDLRALYQRLMDSWNQRDAKSFAAQFAQDGASIGFDGSQLDGQEGIFQEIQRIFHDHQTAAYVTKIREVRFLSPEVAILRAVAGMTRPGEITINPAVNAIHSLVAVKQGDVWRIALFQNTPAQFHGRPDLAQELTEELQKLV